VQYFPRHYRFHLGPSARCPRCGTYRIAKLRGPDRIDPMASGFLNWLERRSGGRLYHCCFCRVQFYDRRGLATETRNPAEESAAGPDQPVVMVAEPPSSK
jgi:DNA-directed RNA polymerase subunit RPC12/RpoP